jgi:hypothetical protein
VSRYNINVTEERYNEICEANDVQRNLNAQIFFIIISSILIYHNYESLFSWISSWNSMDAPYKYSVAFFYYIVVIPFSAIPDVWDWMPTNYKNINIIISAIASFFYTLFVCGGILYAAIKPAFIICFLSGLYFIITFSFTWLFTQ